jgi:hypothetical protein
MSNPHGHYHLTSSYVGQRFGRLVALEKLVNEKIKRNKISFRCVCDCGNETIVRYSNLKAGISRSCGCFKSDRTRETHSKPPRVVRVNAILRYYKRNAKTANRAWELTDEEVDVLVHQPCRYCGDADQQHLRGLDRVDSSKDYVRENVVPCCVICNKAKNTMSVAEFVGWIERVYGQCVRR